MDTLLASRRHVTLRTRAARATQISRLALALLYRFDRTDRFDGKREGRREDIVAGVAAHSGRRMNAV